MSFITSGLWEILDKSGMISHHDHTQEDHYSDSLEKAAEALLGKVLVIYNHKAKAIDKSSMLPSYKKFQEVKKEEHLAIDSNDHVLSPESCLIFMLLYQSEGEDGFFILEQVKANISV